MTLSGGTLKPNGNSEGSGSTSLGGSVVSGTSAFGMGALTLSSNSTLDYGTTGKATLTFTSFSPTAGTILNILNYTNTTENISLMKSGIDGTDDRLIFDANESSNLSDFSFNGVGATEIALGGGYFEIVPVPEPSTWLPAGLSLGAVVFTQRRRLRALLSFA
ncbi:MAG TPA: PEP-CTERM sorting domain-containing protein [Chthoniobacterales bacterium]